MGKNERSSSSIVLDSKYPGEGCPECRRVILLFEKKEQLFSACTTFRNLLQSFMDHGRYPYTIEIRITQGMDRRFQELLDLREFQVTLDGRKVSEYVERKEEEEEEGQKAQAS